MEDRVSELRHVIVSTIKGPSVLQFLVPTVISQCEGTALKRLYRSSTEKANHRLLDLVYISDAPGKWTAFLDALQHAEYSYLLRLLQSTDNRTFNTCSKLIDLFASELELRIRPAELLAALRSKDVISDIDRQEIMAKQTHKGAVEGAMLLLDRIQIHLEPGEWYSRFLKILDENNQRDLVELIDPSFYDEPEVEEVDKETILNRIIVGDRGETRRKCTIKGNEKITATINEFRGEIVELLRADKIVSHLVPDVITRDQASLLRHMEDQNASTQKLLDIVMQEPASAPGFVRGLQDAGFPYLAKLLLKPDYVNNCQYLRKMMSIFEPTIQRLISPADVMGLLVSEELITNKDKDEILSERETHGEIAAVMLMLDCLQCRLEPHIWYTKLLQILVKTDHFHVVKTLDPDYLANPDIFTQKLCKFYASRGGDGLQSTDMRCPMLQDISAAIGFFQKQDNKLLTSANIVKQQIITAAKRNIGAIVERHQDGLAEMVQRESQNIKQKAKRLQEIREELNKSSTKHSILSSECLELIEESHKTIAITFTPNVTSIGDLSVSERIGMPEPGNEMYNVPAPAIPNLLVETKSSGSSPSFLEVSEYQRSQMSEHESNQHGDTESEFDINDEFSYIHNIDFFEHDEFVIGSNYQSAYFELLRSNMSSDIRQTACSDIAMTGVNDQLVGLSTTMSSVCIFDSSDKLLQRFPCEKQYTRLAYLSESEFVVLSFNDSAVHVINTSSLDISDTKSKCTSVKLTVCANDGTAYVFCSAKHVHIYDSRKWEDFNLDGIEEERMWMPIYACIGSQKKGLFVMNKNINDIYCFRNLSSDSEKWSLVYQEKCCYPNDGFIVCGIFCLDDYVLVMDKFNRCLLIYTAEDWLYKDTIEHEVFSACKLVTVGTSPDTLVVVCETIAEQIEINEKEIPVPLEDSRVGNRHRLENVYTKHTSVNSVAISATHGASIGIVTALGAASALIPSYGTNEYDSQNFSNIREPCLEIQEKRDPYSPNSVQDNFTVTDKTPQLPLTTSSGSEAALKPDIDIPGTKDMPHSDKSTMTSCVYLIKINIVK